MCSDLSGEESVKNATTWTHQKFLCNFVKHFSFYQIKWSWTIDLETINIVLFKSSKNVQRIDVFGEQLDSPGFLGDQDYEQATYDPIDHLLIDFDLRESDAMRFFSNKVGPGPTTFYWPSTLVKEIPLTNEPEILRSAGKKPEAERSSESFASLWRRVNQRHLDIINVEILFGVNNLLFY